MYEYWIFCLVLFQRLKAALTHHPAAMSNGNMNTMGHMMEMMSSRQDQTPHHHMHSHPHQHQTLPPHHSYPHQHQHPAHHSHPQPHHQQNHPHHHSHSHLHTHPAHHQTSPHPPLHSGGQAQVDLHAMLHCWVLLLHVVKAWSLCSFFLDAYVVRYKPPGQLINVCYRW